MMSLIASYTASSGLRIVGTVIGLQVNRLAGVLDDDRFLGKLLWLDRRHLQRLRAARNFAEVLLQDGHRLGSLDVAHHGNHDVRPHVVLLVKCHGLGGRDLATSLGQPMPLRP